MISSEERSSAEGESHQQGLLQRRLALEGEQLLANVSQPEIFGRRSAAQAPDLLGDPGAEGDLVEIGAGMFVLRLYPGAHRRVGGRFRASGRGLRRKCRGTGQRQVGVGSEGKPLGRLDRKKCIVLLYRFRRQDEGGKKTYPPAAITTFSVNLASIPRISAFSRLSTPGRRAPQYGRRWIARARDEDGCAVFSPGRAHSRADAVP